MRSFLFFWILFGILIMINIPVEAEFYFDKLTMKVDAGEGKELEKDLYCYSDWQIKNFMMEVTNKFSWPENVDNYSKLNVKAYFEDLQQIKLNLDYQWNERYRFFSPEISSSFKLGRVLTVGFDYETNTRNSVSNDNRELEYLTEIGSVKMKLDKNNWIYSLKLTQTQKSYPADEVKNYTKNQLDQELIWRMGANLNLLLSYFEATGYYPHDININQDYWKTETGIEGEYRFNAQWEMSGSFSAREEEKGLTPYLARQNVKVKLKNKPIRDLDVNFQISSADIDYYSNIPYTDPDGILLEEDDQNSRVENKAALECCLNYRKIKLTVQAGLFLVTKAYNSSEVEDYEGKGLYTTICWNPGNIGLELEIAPEGNLSRSNGFYQLRCVYNF